MSLNIGDRIGDYEVLGVIGVGGMGEVYKVRNTITNRVEAAKVILPNLAENRELAERFLREIRLHASLDHPNIADIRTAFREGNRLIMVMELVEGETLAARLATSRMPLVDSLRCFDQILSAIAYVHEHNLVHRDIKPANIMLTPDGRVKLMDFGVAKGEAGETEAALTKTGFTVGSLHYMSPEQIQAGTLDGRSDIYSLGIVMYEILTGKRPFEGDSEFSVMSAHMNVTPPTPVELDPHIPSQLSDIVLMALSKEPAKRFQTARALQNALRGVAKSLGIPAKTITSAPTSVLPSTPPPSAATPSTPMPPPLAAGAPVPAAKPRSGMRLGYMVIGALAAVLVLALGITQIPKWRSARAEPESGQAADVPAAVSESSPVQEPEQPEPEPATETAGQSPEPATETAGQSPEQPAPTPSTQKTEPPAAKLPPPTPPTRPAASSPPIPAQVAQGEANQMPPIEQTTGFLEAQKAAEAQREAEAAQFAALDELNERQVLMAARASAIGSALVKLEREQSAMGLSLRGDMAAARQLMETRMGQAQAAIEAGNTEAAKKYLEQAESQLRKLERFLNI